ncbi:MAG: hypothetical protein FWF76_03125 [Oscillospiraceae bacterium]|nr:hypothetical protein [Oscillospiraceae bacterium]
MTGNLVGFELLLPKQISKILEKLAQHGYSAYIYGECVRHLITGQTPFEYSVLTDAEMPRLCAIFEDYNIRPSTHATPDVLENAEPLPSSNELQNSKELIVAVLGVSVSLCSCSRDSELQSEIQLRQAFTLNSLAYSAKDGLFDFWSGFDSLKKKEIAFIANDENFNPHDIVHALILAADGEFTISESAKNQIISHYSGTVVVREEIEAVLLGKNAKNIFSEYREVFVSLIPELKMLESSHIFDLDLLSHTFKCVGASSPILNLRYALLFRHLGKPDCYAPPTKTNGEPTFYGHIERSRIYAMRVMERLGCHPSDIDETCDIIENAHHAIEAEPGNLLDLKDEFSTGSLKLYLRFNIAVFRANSDGSIESEKKITKYKKLISLV